MKWTAHNSFSHCLRRPGLRSSWLSLNTEKGKRSSQCHHPHLMRTAKLFQAISIFPEYFFRTVPGNEQREIFQNHWLLHSMPEALCWWPLQLYLSPHSPYFEDKASQCHWPG